MNGDAHSGNSPNSTQGFDCTDLYGSNGMSNGFDRDDGDDTNGHNNGDGGDGFGGGGGYNNIISMSFDNNANKLTPLHPTLETTPESTIYSPGKVHDRSALFSIFINYIVPNLRSPQHSQFLDALSEMKQVNKN